VAERVLDRTDELEDEGVVDDRLDRAVRRCRSFCWGRSRVDVLIPGAFGDEICRGCKVG
jgi:hypothetical protein